MFMEAEGVPRVDAGPVVTAVVYMEAGGVPRDDAGPVWSQP